MSQSTIRKVEVPIYFGKLFIVFCPDFIAAGKRLGIDFLPTVNQCLGLAVRKCTKGPGEYAIFIKAHKTEAYDVFAHEALHLVNYICEDRGIELSTSNDEPQAYLLGWVMEQIIKTRNLIKN